MAEFRINISNLSDGIHEYIFEAEPSRIGLDEHLKGRVQVQVRLDKSLHQILLQSDIQAGGVFLCDRCLEDFSLQVDTAYTMVYIQGDRSTEDVKKEEEIRVLAPDTNFIDLDEDVRQFILLTIPQKLLCREECLGLCPVCGVNKNSTQCTCNYEISDSRWDALKKLSHN